MYKTHFEYYVGLVLKSIIDLPSYVEANPQDTQLSEAYQYLVKMEQQYEDHADKVNNQ